MTMHLFQECTNDGMAMTGAYVPEPSSFAFLALTSLGFLARRRRR